MRIAYLTGRSWRGQPMPPGGLPGIEARDHALLCAEAAALGLSFEPAFWDDPTLAEQGFKGALIRSCWDYIERPDAFWAQLQALAAAGVRVVNSPADVAWNLRKTYLEELARAGAPTIETVWLDQVDAHGVARAFDGLDAAEIVVKPQIGGGGRRTIRLKRNAWSSSDLMHAPLGPAMAQPFLPAISSDGEASLFYFGGKLSHAVIKRPKPGDWFANALDAQFAALAPEPSQVEAAQAALAAAGRSFDYVRVDLVRGFSREWRLIELEAIEPYLFLAYAPLGASVFARALAEAFGV